MKILSVAGIPKRNPITNDSRNRKANYGWAVSSILLSGNKPSLLVFYRLAVKAPHQPGLGDCVLKGK
jgi:hypothetical protein